MTPWHEKYIGKPWEAAPRPPESFNCGELLRYVHLHELGIETPEIEADVNDLKQCVMNMRPEVFGLRPLAEGEAVQEFDCAFFARAARYEDHCGLAAITTDGLLILHCLRIAGVVLERPIEALARGFKEISWYRHKRFDE